jgi:N-acetylglucosamine malate deacetylase 2
MPPGVTAGVTDGPAARYVRAADSSLRPADPTPAAPAWDAPTGPVAPHTPSAPCTSLAPAAPVARDPLPRAEKVLAVIARPGQESVNLGALLYAFRKAGASLALLCVTRGEASPLNSTCERLETRRPWELLVAGAVLGVSSVTVADYPDGGLAQIPLAELTELASREIRRHTPGLLLVVDPAASANGSASPGHDDAVVTRAVRAAATMAGVPVAAIVTTGARGGQLIDLATDPATARTVQRSAAAAHLSQREAGPEVERRLELLGGRETLRWLVPAPRPSARP